MCYYVVIHDSKAGFKYEQVEADSPIEAARIARGNAAPPNTVLVFDTPPLFEKRVRTS